MSAFYGLVRPFLGSVSPETAHGLTISALKSGFGPAVKRDAHASLAQSLFGLEFPNPIGLAAGFDKNAEVPDAMLRLGFGFVECGTVTPLPQDGNPKPRIFRLVKDRAVINRLGFNNDGLVAMQSRLRARAGKAGPVGANLGANKDSQDRAADYAQCLQELYPLADYFTVNVSSPNTPGLRGLQDKGALEGLLGAVMRARRLMAGGQPQKPVLLKVAPDLGEGQVEDICGVALDSGIDGIIVSNTTIARPDSLRDPAKGETGGLSGPPLFAPSTRLLSEFYRELGGRLPLIGVGGVGSAADAYAKIRAGACLVQLYTALVYEGPDLVGQMLDGLAELVRLDGFETVGEAVGAGLRPVAHTEDLSAG